MGETLMPIGRFSKSCRLSIKALRHYDEQGLLRPAHVDPAWPTMRCRPGCRTTGTFRRATCAKSI
jgi:hypothetical protein